MLHIFVIRAPGNDLDGESFEIQDSSRDRADERAAERVRETFSISKRRDARAVHVAAFASRDAYRKAHAAAHESGVSLTSNDVDAVLDVCIGEELAS